MSATRAAGQYLRATVRAIRSDPDPSTEVDPRAERLIAAAIGAIVLCGAVGTYLAVVGGLGPLSASAPTTGHSARPPVVTTQLTPTPAPTATASPTPGPTRTPTPQPTRHRDSPKPTSATAPTSPIPTPSTTASPTPTPTPNPTTTPTAAAQP